MLFWVSISIVFFLYFDNVSGESVFNGLILKSISSCLAIPSGLAVFSSGLAVFSSSLAIPSSLAVFSSLRSIVKIALPLVPISSLNLSNDLESNPSKLS